MRAVISREGGFIKHQKCLDDLNFMDVFVGFIMPALDMRSDEIYRAKDRKSFTLSASS